MIKNVKTLKYSGSVRLLEVVQSGVINEGAKMRKMDIHEIV
jgi:hypothetical protein